MAASPVHQLVHTLSYGDAISSEVIALQRCLREADRQSEIYAINVHPHYKKPGSGVPHVLNYRDFPKGFSGEVVLHYSLGSPLNQLFRETSGATRVIIYHNLTPAKWFRAVNPRIVHDIEEGARELPELCRLANKVLADSEFNASELKAFGVSAKVLSLTVDPTRWSEPRNEGIYSLLKNSGGKNIVHVGRLAPNKCVEDIIKSFYFFHHYVAKGSKLWLAGIDIDTELYSFGLKRLAHELGLDEAVNFMGCAADSEIRALYEAGDLYICMSEHEGFCLPLIEAMHFAMPVVAFASSAVPDTMGNAGVLLSEKKHAEIAELMGEVCSNQSLRSSLIEAGRRRVGELSFDKFSAQVREIF